jgi:hypothetical protein
MARKAAQRITLRPDATQEERAAYIKTLGKRARLALLRAESGPLHITSDERTAARDAQRDYSKGV